MIGQALADSAQPSRAKVARQTNRVHTLLA